jgi:hypothetical protein
MRIQRYSLAFIIAVVTAFAIASVLSEIPIEYRVPAVLASVALSAFCALKWFDFAVQRQTRKLLKEGDNNGIIGFHQLRCSDEYLTEITEVNESKHKLSAIKRIEETAEYAFIYITAMQAHVIPKKRIVSGDFGHFLTCLRSRTAQ